MSDIEKKDLTGKFSIQLILSKLEQKLTNFYNTGIKKIKEIAEELSNSKKSQIHS